MTVSAQPVAVKIALGVLALCVAWLLAAPLYRMGLWLEMPNEGWNATHALNAFTSALYPPRGSFFINNYPPLWPYLTGGLAQAGLDAIFAGRAIAFAAFLATAFGIALMLRRLQASAVAAALGALSFMLILGGLLEFYVGLAEPQMLAHAFVTVGAGLLVGARSKPEVIIAAVFTALGMLTKQVVIALPLASVIWLVIYRRPFVVTWLATGAVIGVAALIALLLMYGQAFIDNMLFPRVLDWSTLGKNVALISKAAVPLVIFAAVAWQHRHRRDAAVAFAALAIAAGVLELFLFGAARGVSINVVFDLVVAAAIGLGLAWDRIDRNIAAWRVAIVAALIARVAIGVPYASVALPFDATVRARLHERSDTMLKLREALRTTQGPVACETLSVCVWAGKRNDVDLWKLHYETTLGPFMDTAALTRRIAQGEFGAVVLFGVPPVIDRQIPGLAAALAAGSGEPQVFGGSASLFTPKNIR